AAAGQRDTAAERWRAAAAKTGDERLAAWFLARAAKALAGGARWREADTLYAEAPDGAERAVGRQAAARLLLQWGDTGRSRGQWNDAAERYRRSLELARESGGENLTVASAQNALGVLAGRRGDPDEAEAYFRQALAL